MSVSFFIECPTKNLGKTAHNRFFRTKNTLCVFLVGRTSAHSHVRSVVRITVARSYAFGPSVVRFRSFGRTFGRSVGTFGRTLFGRTKIVPHLVPHEALIVRHYFCTTESTNTYFKLAWLNDRNPVRAYVRSVRAYVRVYVRAYVRTCVRTDDLTFKHHCCLK